MSKEQLIGLIADTHDNRVPSAKAIAQFNERGVDLVLHAGDFIAPFNAREFSRLAARMIGVFGNNDGERFGLRRMFAEIGEILVAPHEFEHAGRRVILMHEPIALDALAESGRYDVIVYGHTHEVDVRKGRTLIVNPGECGGWLNGRCTAAVLDPERMEVEILDLS